MKTQNKLILVTALTVLISGCAKKSNLDTVSQDRKIFDQHVSECNYENGTPNAPKWICGYPISEQYPISEVGYSRAGSVEAATLTARAKLAERILIRIESEGTLTQEAYGTSKNERFSQVTIGRVNQQLTNTRVLLRIREPNSNGIYVAVVADLSAYEETMRWARQELLR